MVARHLQLVLGLSPLQAGLWTIPWPLAFVVGSLLTPKIVRRARTTPTIVGGLAVAAAGFGLLVWAIEVSGPSVSVLATVVMSLGLAPVFTLATDLVVGAAPPERAGVASAISETSSEFGGALGIAIFGSIGTAVYRSELGEVAPIGIPTQALEAARNTLGAAVEAARQLGEPLGALLLQASRCSRGS